MLVVGGPEPGELEEDYAQLRAEGFGGLEETDLEDLGVEKVFVGFSGAKSESAQVRELLQGDGVGDLQADPEVLRHRSCEFFKCSRRGKS